VTAPAMTTQPRTCPGWCARHVSDVHVSAPETREGEQVQLIQYGTLPPLVHVGLLDPMTPAGALRFARFLSAHQHPELAALVTRTAGMATS